MGSAPHSPFHRQVIQLRTQSDPHTPRRCTGGVGDRVGDDELQLEGVAQAGVVTREPDSDTKDAVCEGCVEAGDVR